MTSWQHGEADAIERRANYLCFPREGGKASPAMHNPQESQGIRSRGVDKTWSGAFGAGFLGKARWGRVKSLELASLANAGGPWAMTEAVLGAHNLALG